MARAAALVCLVGLAGPAAAATFTVTSTNNAGGGSLRTAINNANGAAGGPHTIAFAIPTTAAGYNAGTGVWTLSITSTLPAITSAGLLLNGTTQTTNIGNTNPGTLGVGGTVGVDALALPVVNRPEIQIQDGNNLGIGLDIQAANVTIRGVAIFGFGGTPDSDTNANIRVGNFTGAVIEQNIIGTTATAFTDPGATRSGGDNVRAVQGDNGTLRNNLIGFNAGKGLGGTNANGWVITGNEMRRTGIGTATWDCISLLNSSGALTVRGNLLIESNAMGFDSIGSSGGNRLENNTIMGNGIGGGGNPQTAGARLYGAGNVVDRNIIRDNVGAGVLVASTASSSAITRNSFFGNGPASGQIGIDLLRAADNQDRGTAPFITINDNGDGDAGGNGLLNFPVLSAALLGGGQLVLTGYARPGSVIELFVATPDPAGFGEGTTFVTTLTEGSGADTDGTTGLYTSPINGLNVGTDNTNRFRFLIPAPGGVAAGTVLTATATVAGATSEFSGNVTVSLNANVTLLKSVSPGGPRPPGTELAWNVVFTNGGGSTASAIVVRDPVPANTDFKLGSVTTNMGTTGLIVTITYSDNGGGTWTYTPVSGGGGAPAGYDRNVTHVRYVFTGTLSQTAPNNTGSLGFTARIR
jgi:uncharacterized repeat protein (TIGR01451 family)